MAKVPIPSRSIRSYVLRQGRLTEAQRLALKRLWPLYGLTWEGGQIEPATLFKQNAPLCMEIGFGNGTALLEMATCHPERNFLGVEVHGPGIGHLLLGLETHQLNNVRVLRDDAVAFLSKGLPEACLDRLYLFFPDPWPKKRHHKRRIIQIPFLELVAKKLKPQGCFHMTTDWQNYADYMLAIADEVSSLFCNQAGAGCFNERPPNRPYTHFEARGKRLGHKIWDLILERKN